MAYFYDYSNSYQRTSSNVKFLFADTPSDIENLPTNQHEGVPQGNDSTLHLKCSPGSMTTVIEPAQVWVLNSLGEWKQIG